jgi:hypothetical protein
MTPEEVEVELQHLGARVDALTHAVQESLQQLANNDSVLSGVLEVHDTRLAALFALLLGKGVCTQGELEAGFTEMERVRESAYKVREQQQQMMQEDPALAGMLAGVQDTAGNGPPPEAFIFGGK